MAKKKKTIIENEYGKLKVDNADNLHLDLKVKMGKKFDDEDKREMFAQMAAVFGADTLESFGLENPFDSEEE